MDDIRPPRPGSGSYPNRSSQPNQIYNQSPAQDQPADNSGHLQDANYGNEDYHLPDKQKKSGKGKTFALVLFIILFLAAAGVAAYLYFVKMAQMQDEIDDLKKQNDSLVQQVRSLDYDNRDLQQKLIIEQQKNQQPETPANDTEQPAQ